MTPYTTPLTASARAMALALSTGLFAASPAVGQHAHGQHVPPSHAHGAHAHATPYAGLQQRAIKALSPQQVADLRAGKGMGTAMAAELNGYPGPMHTLELAERLQLSPEQTARTQALFAQMQQEAQRAGEAVIDAEAALDALFRDKRAQPDSVAAAVARAAQAAGALRETHLRYHLHMMGVLTADQVAAYARLRGY